MRREICEEFHLRCCRSALQDKEFWTKVVENLLLTIGIILVCGFVWNDSVCGLYRINGGLYLSMGGDTDRGTRGGFCLAVVTIDTRRRNDMSRGNMLRSLVLAVMATTYIAMAAFFVFLVYQACCQYPTLQYFAGVAVLLIALLTTGFYKGVL